MLQLFAGFIPVAVCGCTEPLSAVVFSAVFLKEFMLPVQIAGAALIICGALYGDHKNRVKAQQR